jgi:hypothetical protein
MKNLESEFIPYNLALRMKALSYKEKVLTYYENGVPKLYNDILGWDFNSSFLTCCSRPTFQSAFSWLIPQIDDEFKVCLDEQGWYIYNLENEIFRGDEALEKLIEIVEQKQLKND